MSVDCVLSQESYNALHNVYDAFNGEYWIHNNKSQVWTFPSPLSDPCQIPWQGVVCVNATGQCEVQALKLHRMNLTGTLPTQMTLLSHLGQLNLSVNSIFGSLPDSWSSLQSLSEISLNANCISHSLPSNWSTLTNLRLLELINNNITKSLPNSWSLFGKIEHMKLSFNHLTGRLPSSWSAMTNLRDVSVEDNSITGPLPSCWNSMVNLTNFIADKNSISGSLPDSWSSMKRLQYLGLSYNSLTGNLPSLWSSMTNLVEINVLYNGLEGTIPRQWSTMTNMINITLGYNQISGYLPDTWDNLVNINQILTFHNLLSGTLPSSWSSMTKIKEINWYSNHIVGSLPAEWSTMNSMESLEGYDNYITGILPDSWSSMTALSRFIMSVNSLSGTLPESWSTMINMVNYYVQYNYLTGTLPNLWTFIKQIGIGGCSNHLTGTLPESWSAMTTIQVIYLQSNSFSGLLPTSWSYMRNLTLWNFEQNALQGIVPTSFCNWDSLKYLSASHNFLSGSMNLCSLSLSSIDISCNTLTNIQVPYKFQLNINQLNISHNDIKQSIEPFNYIIAWNNIKSVDISFNKFTGYLSIPGWASGTSYSLIVLDVSNNCLSTKIDVSICALTNLTSFLASNMYNGQKCGESWFNIATKPQPYPSCILKLPNLQAISLIGNGLSGSLVDIDLLTSQLSFVGLVSNRLTGTLPESWQTYGRFDQLLLSFNKLSGLFQSDFAVQENMTNLNMSINRFSGTLPASFANLHQMDVIEGNIISCKSVPTYNEGNDVSANSYECGSLSLDVVGAVAGVCVVCIGILLWRTYNIVKIDLKALLAAFLLQHESNKLQNFLMGISAICLLIVIVCLSITNASSDYVYEYGWVTTTAFLHGWYCALVLFLVLVTSSLLLTIVGVSNTRLKGRVSISSLMLSSDVLNRKLPAKVFAKLLGYHTINVVFIGGMTTLYVLIILSYSSRVGQLLFSIVLSIIKVMWGEFVIPRVFHNTIQRDVLTSSDQSNSFLRATKMISLYPEVLLHEMIADLWCYVVCPLIVILLISQTCYRYLLSGMPEIEMSYEVDSIYWSSGIINTYGNHSISTIAPVTTPILMKTSVSPPWLYSYQCSSAILTSYVAVVLYTYIMYTLIWPAARIALYINNMPFFKTNLVEIIMADNESNDISVIRDRISFESIHVTSKKHRTHIRHYVMFMIFGLSSPLLGLLILLAINMEDSLYIWEVCKLRDAIMTSFRMTEAMANSLCEGLLLHDVSNVYNRYLPWVSLISVGYWSLYAFDSIGDVYGEYLGTVSSLLYLSINVTLFVCIFAVVRRWQWSNKHTSSLTKHSSLGISMITMELNFASFKSSFDCENNNNSLVSNPISMDEEDNNSQ